jgi:hypothetical protein
MQALGCRENERDAFGNAGDVRYDQEFQRLPGNAGQIQACKSSYGTRHAGFFDATFPDGRRLRQLLIISR